MLKQILLCMFLVYGTLIFCSQVFAQDLSKQDIDHIKAFQDNCIERGGIFLLDKRGMFCFDSEDKYLEHLEKRNKL